MSFMPEISPLHGVEQFIDCLTPDDFTRQQETASAQLYSLRTQTSFPTLILRLETNICGNEREFDFRDVCLLSVLAN
jgi:hypothetical protein